MPCSLNPHIFNAKDCQKCYDQWPEKAKQKYSRAQCKRRYWEGKVDESKENSKVTLPETYHQKASRFEEI